MTPAAPFALTRIRRRISLMKRGARRRRRRAIAWSMLVVNTTALLLIFCFVALRCPHKARVCDETSRLQGYELLKAAALFELQHDRRPSSLDELTLPVDGKRPILERVPTDAHGRPYVLVFHPSPSSELGVLSPGEDGLFFTDDDIRTW